MKPIERARAATGSGKYERIRTEVRVLVAERGPMTFDEMADALGEERGAVYQALRPLRRSRRLVRVGRRRTGAARRPGVYAFTEPLAGGAGALAPLEQQAILYAVRQAYGEAAADALADRLDLHARVLRAIEEAVQRESADELLEALDEGRRGVRRSYRDRGEPG